MAAVKRSLAINYKRRSMLSQLSRDGSLDQRGQLQNLICIQRHGGWLVGWNDLTLTDQCKRPDQPPLHDHTWRGRRRERCVGNGILLLVSCDGLIPLIFSGSRALSIGFRTPALYLFFDMASC